jgi:lysophospholipase L1-like esterase
LTIIFLGANDAVLKETNPQQHVALNTFEANLKSLCEPFQRHHIPLILITPPPIYEAHWDHHRRLSGRFMDRSAQQTAIYASRVVEVGRSLNTPVVDIHSIMLEHVKSESGKSGVPGDEVLAGLFCDGLHLSKEGNQMVFREVIRVIHASFPNLHVDRLRMEV